MAYEKSNSQLSTQADALSRLLGRSQPCVMEVNHLLTSSEQKWIPTALLFKTMFDSGLSINEALLNDMKAGCTLERMLYALATSDPICKKDKSLKVKFCYHLSIDFVDPDVLKTKSVVIERLALRRKPGLRDQVSIYALSDDRRRAYYNEKGWAEAKMDPNYSFRRLYYDSVKWKDYDWYCDREMDLIKEGITLCPSFVNTEGLQRFALKLTTNKTGMEKLFYTLYWATKHSQARWQEIKPQFIKFFSLLSPAQNTAIMFSTKKEYIREFFKEVLVKQEMSEGGLK